MNITNTIRYAGVNDHDIDLFEGQYIVKNGMSYNSYVILDDKIAVFDTVDGHFGDVWMKNVRDVIQDREPDYLIVSHMESDHSANIDVFLQAYPNVKVVATAKAFVMMKQFFGMDYSDRRIVVKDQDTLSLGQHVLTFISAPMVHWPEVMMTYDAYDHVLFTADAFGKFGALDVEDDWAKEARRYYIGIVGKYGMQVQSVLKKIAKLDIAMICPLHGPLLQENLPYYLNLYQTWSSYEVETPGIFIAYNTIYGNTRKAVELLVEKLKENGSETIIVRDLARCDMAEAIENAFRYGKIVFATPTYNADIFPFMREFIHGLIERNFQNRTIALIENGSWAPAAANVMRKMLEKSKNLTYTNTTVRIMSSLNEESIAQIDALAKELCESA